MSSGTTNVNESPTAIFGSSAFRNRVILSPSSTDTVRYSIPSDVFAATIGSPEIARVGGRLISGLSGSCVES